MSSLSSYMPAIVTMGETAALIEWFTVCKTQIWSPIDLVEWLHDKEELGEEEAEAYSLVLIDTMIEQGHGEEYMGITPWCGEGFHFFSCPFDV